MNMSQDSFLNAVHTLALMDGAEKLLTAAANSANPAIAEVAEQVANSLREVRFPVTHANGHWYIGLPPEYQPEARDWVAVSLQLASAAEPVLRGEGEYA